MQLCFLELYPLKKYFEVIKINMIKTYSPRKRKPITFMYFWLNYCDKNRVGRIPIAVKNNNHIFCMAGEIIEADRLHLFLLSDGTRINNNLYLESPEKHTELIVCTEKQIQKLCIYFELKRYLSLKNISYLLDIDYFL